MPWESIGKPIYLILYVYKLSKTEGAHHLKDLGRKQFAGKLNDGLHLIRLIFG